MGIKEIKNKDIWEGFLEQCERKTFLQSWSWGEFQKSLRNSIWRFGIYENSDLIGVALVVKISAKRSSFLLVPHGPIASLKIKNQKLKIKILETLLNKLKSIAKERGVDFIRISPIWERNDENNKIFQELGFKTAPLHYHPESSWKLSVEKSEQEILSGMRKTTRYLIRQAQNDEDIEIIKSANPKDMEVFYKIHQKVVEIQKFVPFSLDYLTKEFQAFLPDNVLLFLAKYRGEIIAGSFEIFWSGIGFYHHAALLPEHKKVPVSCLLQWEAIKEAKKRSCRLYDFWGYANPKKNLKHPYAGPTLFKMGFGGYVDEYVRTQDFIISPKYWLNYIVETARRIRRGL